jgi:hypothetical protein
MENQEQTQVENTEAAAAPELSINDLKNLRTIVDIAVRRGAFGAAEVSAVGATFDRINSFLNAVAPPAEQAPQEQAPEA